MKKISFTSSVNKSKEQALFYMPKSQKKTPLLVGLHTWSADMYNQEKQMLPFAKKYKW